MYIKFEYEGKQYVEHLDSVVFEDSTLLKTPSIDIRLESASMGDSKSNYPYNMYLEILKAISKGTTLLDIEKHLGFKYNFDIKLESWK